MKYNDTPNKEVFHVRRVFPDPHDKMGRVIALLELDNGEAKMVNALVEHIKFTNETQKVFVDTTSNHVWIVEELLLRRT
jgi:hypothetical protein